MPRARRLVLTLGCALVAALAAAPAQAHVSVSVAPGLRPAFDRSVTDYVSRCAAGEPLRVTVVATDGARVSVAGRPERAGSFTAAVRRSEGARMSIAVRGARGAISRYSVRCLPHDFPRWHPERRGPTQAQWYVVAPVGRFVTIFDSRGTPVWWRRSTEERFVPWDAKLLAGGNVLWGNDSGHFGTHPDASYEIHGLAGRLVRRIRTVGSPTDMHDIEQLPNGDFLGTTYRPREHVDLSQYGGSSDARVFDAEIQELDRAGRVVWHWNSAGHVSPSETGRSWWYDESHGKPPERERGYDLLHVNSVQPDGDGVIVSARHLNAVLRIDRRTGKIDWKLGGTYVAGESLQVLGVPPPNPVLFGQHDARLWSDGTLTVFDNRAYTGNAPAAVRFRIDPLARTATRIEEIQNPAAPVSTWGGSARKMPGGDWVVQWGGTHLMSEQTPAGAVVFSMKLPDDQPYRALGVPAGVVSAARLRHGMDRMARVARRG